MLSEIAFPPSVNWNLPQIADSNERFFVYGAKNRLVFLTLNSNHPGYITFLTQFDAHKEKVVGVKCRKFISPQIDNVKSLVASAGEDGIRIWDMSNDSPVMDDYHVIHKAKPTSLAWKDNDADNSDSYLASGDMKGCVVLYSLSSRNYLMKSFENDAVTCLEFAPACQNRHLLAVSYKNGLIAIVNTEFVKLDLVTRLRSTDEKIENISWCPFTASSDLTLSWFPNLMATTSSRTVRFYHVVVGQSSSKTSEGETKFLFYKRLPMKIPGGKAVKPYEAKNATKAYFFAIWAKKNLILTGSLNGELVCGDIFFDTNNEDPNDKNESNESRIISVSWRKAGGDSSLGHTRAIQSITLFQNQIITHSVDRYLCLWSFPNLKNFFTISTFGGSIFDIDISPVSKSWVAIASGGGFLYIWNCALAESSLTKKALGVSEGRHDDRFRMQHIWQGGKVKVTVVCFHPKREGLLAFGTEDGKVALYDVCNNKPAITSITFHTRTVYSLSWGPEPPEVGGTNNQKDETELNSKVSKKYSLYSCGGEGVIYIHCPTNMNCNAVNLNERIARDEHGKIMATDENRSSLQWHPSLSLIAVGNFNGTIDVYNIMFQLTCVVELHGKTIYHMAWQPLQDPDDLSAVSDFLLAVSCKSENIVKVVSIPVDKVSVMTSSASDMTSLASDVMSAVSDVASLKTISDVTCELIGHKKRLGQVSWSVHNKNHLLSTSNDGSVQIWDLENKFEPKPVCNYMQSREASATSATFSLNDPDLVYSSGTDFMMQCWRPSNQTNVNPPTSSSVSSFLQSLEHGEPEMVPANDTMSSNMAPHVINGCDDAEVYQETQVYQSGNYVASDFENIRGTALGKTKQEGSVVSDSSKEVKMKKKKAKSLLKVSSGSRKIGPSVDDTRNLFEFLTGDDERKKELIKAAANNPEHGLMYSGIFAGNAAAFCTLTQECALSKFEGDIENVSDLLLTMGNIEEAIDYAIANGCLKEKHVAASFLGGFSLWKKCVEGLHKQCLEVGNINDAAHYLLLLNRIYDAMKLYQDHGKYREALAIGAMRLAPSDEYLKQTYLAYASVNENNACEVSAQSYLAAGDFLAAARSLSSRNNLAANMLALDILLEQRNHGNVPEELIQYLITFCVIRQLCQFDIAQSKQTVSKFGHNIEFDALILSFDILLSSVKKVFEVDLIEEYNKIAAFDNVNQEAPEVFKAQEWSSKISVGLFESRNRDFMLNFVNRSKIELEVHLKTITQSTLAKLENFLLTSRIPLNGAMGKDLLLLCIKLLLLISSNVENELIILEDENPETHVTKPSNIIEKLAFWISEKLKPHVVGPDANLGA